MKLIRYEYPTLPVFNEFDRLLDDFWSNFGRFPMPERLRSPAMDLYEDDHNYYVRIELPGFKQKDLNVQLENAVLTVTAERKSEEKDGEQREHSRVSRSVSVPDGVDTEKVAAKLEDGVLTVTLPKAEAARPRAIEVQ